MNKLRKLKLISRNKSWLKSSIPLGYRLLHYPSSLISLATNRKCISYIGNKFYYDNFVTPLSIQAYPSEVDAVLQNVNSKIVNVLDIGGNIGQFSITLKNINKLSRIDVFEPNPEIYDLLLKNTQHYRQIRTYNYGVGDPLKTTKLNFVKGKSATGSFFADNATNQNESLMSLDVNIVKDIATLTKKTNYDLIKIDVEGFEYNVIEMLGNIETKFLFVEVSGTSRYKNYSHSGLFRLVEEIFGEFDIRYITEFESDNDNFEILFSF